MVRMRMARMVRMRMVRVVMVMKMALTTSHLLQKAIYIDQFVDL
jgi:hypothetical protein